MTYKPCFSYIKLILNFLTKITEKGRADSVNSHAVEILDQVIFRNYNWLVSRLFFQTSLIIEYLLKKINENFCDLS